MLRKTMIVLAKAAALTSGLTVAAFAHGDAGGMRGPRYGWFYGRLFEIAPAVTPLLRGDMTEQHSNPDGHAGPWGRQYGQSRSRVAPGARSSQPTPPLSLQHTRFL